MENGLSDSINALKETVAVKVPLEVAKNITGQLGDSLKSFISPLTSALSSIASPSFLASAAGLPPIALSAIDSLGSIGSTIKESFLGAIGSSSDDETDPVVEDIGDGVSKLVDAVEDEAERDRIESFNRLEEAREAARRDGEFLAALKNTSDGGGLAGKGFGLLSSLLGLGAIFVTGFLEVFTKANIIKLLFAPLFNALKETRFGKIISTGILRLKAVAISIREIFKVYIFAARLYADQLRVSFLAKMRVIFKPLVKSKLFRGFEKVLTVMKTGLRVILFPLKLLGESLKPIGTAILSIKNLLVGKGSVLSSFRNVKAFKPLLAIFKTMGKFFGFLLGPLPLLIFGIIATIKGFFAFKDTFTKAREKGDGLLESLLAGALAALREVLQVMVFDMIDGIVNLGIKGLALLLNFLGFEDFAKKFANLQLDTGKLFDNFVDSFVTPIITFVKDLFLKYKEFLFSLFDFFGSIARFVAVGDVDSLKAAGIRLFDSIKSMFEFLIGKITAVAKFFGFDIATLFGGGDDKSSRSVEEKNLSFARTGKGGAFLLPRNDPGRILSAEERRNKTLAAEQATARIGVGGGVITAADNSITTNNKTQAVIGTATQVRHTESSLENLTAMNQRTAIAGAF